jgi:putative drug exporter of the RND superfamily
VASLGVLLLLAVPVLSLRMGSTDAGNDPKSSTTRQAYDMLSTGFGPGFNGPFQLAADLGGAGGTAKGMAVLNKLADELRTTPDVAQVSPPIPNQAGDAAVIFLTPKSAPQDVATTKLIHHLRKDVIPAATAGTGVQVHVGAITAVFNDLADLLGRRLPLFIGAVLLLSFLLLLAVFRSVLVPLKAALMNLFSIGASFGILVAVFQWGWGANLIGVGKKGPIVAFSPMMLFAILFGLSMDYEVFLLSRVKEEHDRTHDNGLAVADGLAATARVITAAAAIMICVFLTFVFQADATAKLIGLGLATAILIDATVVRMILVPATMELLGEANWWLPRWLDRLLPRLNVEGASVLSAMPEGPELGEHEPVPAGR